MIYEFDNELYPRKLWITFSPTQEELNNYFENDDVEVPQGGQEAYCMKAYKDWKGPGCIIGYLLVFKYKNVSLTTIVHEAVHAAISIYTDISAPINEDTTEHMAYLTEWIVKKVLEIRKIKEK